MNTDTSQLLNDPSENFADLEFTPKIVKQIHHKFEELKISPFLTEDGVTEIVINEPNKVFVEKHSKWNAYEVSNDSNEQINGLGTLLVNNTGIAQNFDKENPMLSLTMPGGERAQLVRQPACEDASLTVRIPSKHNFTIDQYEKAGIFSEIIPASDELNEDDAILLECLENHDYRRFIEKAVAFHKNIIISGATGSGKTTFMKTMLDLISRNERIITIEDAREIFIDHPNRVHLMYPKSMSQSSLTAKSCLEATLRMKPDRIILAEVRGDEAFYFIRACGNGHSGSITSCHADSALMAYEQISLMISASPEGANLSHDVIKRLIMMTIDISIHFTNHAGVRRISGIDFDPRRKQQLLRHT